MKRHLTKTQWMAIALTTILMTWIWSNAFAGRGGGPHGGGAPGGGNFHSGGAGPGGAGGFHPGGAGPAAGFGSGGFHPGGNFGAGGAGFQQNIGNAGATTFQHQGNFNPNAFNRPTQGHAPSFSFPGQGTHTGQNFPHHTSGNVNLPNTNNLSGQTLHKPTNNLPNNFIPGQTLNPNINNKLPSNFIPGQTQRPHLGDRPTNIGNHTNFINNNSNNFVHGGNTNNVVVNKPVVGGNTFNNNFNNQNFNNQNFNHNYNNFNNGFANQNSWYHGHWHNNWNNGFYHRPTTWWGGGYGFGYGGIGLGAVGFGYPGYGYGGYALASTPWNWGYYNYYNPYYTQPLVGGYAGFDYSQPIVMNQIPAQPVVNTTIVANDPNLDPNQAQVANVQQNAQDLASQALAQARDSFMRGDYPTALTQADQAVAQLPNDPIVHEFRGLVLFALGRYKEAAAAEYGVLSVGPGWDWTTVSSLYPDTDTYTGQLRALEQYTNENPRQPEARFLLAYHYMTCGHMEDATAELKAAVQLNPKDQLSAQLLSSLTAPQQNQAQGEAPAVASQPDPNAQPIDPASLVGNWQSTRPDGSSFALNLNNDNTFTWKFTAQGKTQSFSGPYTIENNALTLKQNDQPAMVGIITPMGNGFNFKVGNNPADPGLNFTR